MIKIPVLRWGEPYESLETDKVVHFATGEVVAEVGRANAAMVERAPERYIAYFFKRLSAFADTT